MNPRINLIKNTILLFIARIANPASTIAIGLYIAKSLGVEAFGHFSFILSYFFLFSVIFSLGLGTIITRDTAQKPDQTAKYFSGTSVIGIISGAAGLLIMFLAANFFNLPEEAKKALYILGLAIFSSILIFIWEALLITFEKNQYIIVVQSIESVVKLTFGFFILYEGYGIVLLMTIFMLTRYLSLLLYYLALKKVFHPLTFYVDLAFVKKILLLVPTFAGLYIFSVLFSKTDMLMLALMKNFNDVGIYSAAYKLLEIAFMLPICVITVFFPVLSRYAKESPEKFSRVSSQGIFFSLTALLPVVVIAVYLADMIIFTVYSREFSGSILPFQILIVTLGFYMIDQILAHSLVAQGFQNLNLKALMTATLINIVLNILLIPAYGYVGTSIATVASMAVLTCIHYYYVRKHLFKFNFFRLMMIAFMGLLVAGGISMFRDFSLLILLPLSCLIYASLIIFMKGFLFEYDPVPVQRLTR